MSLSKTLEQSLEQLDNKINTTIRVLPEINNDHLVLLINTALQEIRQELDDIKFDVECLKEKR